MLLLKKIAIVLLLGLSIGTIVACNTMEGFGDDVTDGENSIESAIGTAISS